MGQDRFDKGLKLRKQVLGADYVERSMAGADEFSMPIAVSTNPSAAPPMPA